MSNVMLYLCPHHLLCNRDAVRFCILVLHICSYLLGLVFPAVVLSTFPCSFHSNTYAKAKWICFVCFQLCMHFYGHLTTNLHNSCKSIWLCWLAPFFLKSSHPCFWESFLHSFSSSLWSLLTLIWTSGTVSHVDSSNISHETLNLFSKQPPE